MFKKWTIQDWISEIYSDTMKILLLFNTRCSWSCCKFQWEFNIWSTTQIKFGTWITFTIHLKYKLFLSLFTQSYHAMPVFPLQLLRVHQAPLKLLINRSWMLLFKGENQVCIPSLFFSTETELHEVVWLFHYFHLKYFL